MAANLDRPKIIIPSGCPNGAVVVGTGADVLVHTLVSGDDEIDAVTVECFGTTAGTLKWPTTTGGLASIALTPTSVDGSVPIVQQWTGNGGGAVYVNGAATVAFKVGVTRHSVSR